MAKMKIILTWIKLLLICLVLGSTCAQAPGDEDSRCNRSPYDHTYPDNVKVLMDSWNYENLLPGSGSGSSTITNSVWDDVSCDGNDHTSITSPTYWQHGGGGICRFQSQVCGFTQGDQDNWLFTQHISKAVPAADTYTVRVFVNITFTFRNCRERSNCNSRFKINKYFTNTQQSAAFTCNDKSLYSSSGIMPNNVFGPERNNLRVTDQHYLDMTASQDGLYLALQDYTMNTSQYHLRGTCVTISRFLVYRHECRGQVVGLVRYPATQAPVNGTRSVTTQCVDSNSHNSSALTKTCDSNGEWGNENPQCICNDGYELKNNKICQACSVGTFKSTGLLNCTVCPNNSISEKVAATWCTCTPNYFRVGIGNPFNIQAESVTADCSAAPSKPTNLQVTAISNTTVSISWGKPESDGGRYDIFYHIYVEEIGTLRDSTLYSDNYTAFNYIIDRLKPVTQYRISVIAQNGVSYLDSEEHRVMGRTADTVVMTKEGNPEEVSNVEVVDNLVIVWGPPKVPNGNITGYEILLTFCATEGSGESEDFMSDVVSCFSHLTPLDADKFFFVLRESLVPDYSNELTFNIRAKTGQDRYGVWSEDITFEPFAAPNIPECPSTDTEIQPLEDCVEYMGITAGAVFVITLVITFLFSCALFCICHKYKMKTYEIKLKKEVHSSKWDY